MAIVGWLVALALGIVFALFSVGNQQPAVINVLGATYQDIPTWVVMLACAAIGALLGFPNPIGAVFGLLMSALLIKVVRLEMERFSKGLLIGIVIAGIFFVYLIFLLIFSILFSVLEPILQPLVGRTFKQ